MGLVIRAPRRLRRSRRFTFDDDVELVVIGRDPDRCQIMFPPRTRAVGLEHLALERVLGHYRLVLNAEDPVFVNGREAVDGQELPDRCVLQLGAHGPRLIVERQVRQDLPPVEREMEAHGRRASPRRLLSSVRTNRNLALGAAALVIVVAGVVVWSTWRPEPPAAPTEETMLRAALEQAAPSVYRVVLRTADGGEYSGATAWVVAPGRLATNAHVAGQFAERPPGARVQVRSSDADPKTYDVLSVTMHPGYEAFETLWAGYQPAEGARAGHLRPIRSAGGGADVAFLDVDPAAALGRPLPLADEQTLLALAPGDPVGYVGYPSESLALQGSPVQRPTAHRHTGRITLVTNLFGASGPASENLLIQHTCPATGGASGSPLLDARGRVVGLVSAANFGHGFSGRIPSGAGINFAQRVDLLRELLEGRAEELQPERLRQWTACLEDLYPSAWRIGRRRAVDERLKGLSDAHQLVTRDAEYLAWTRVSTQLVDAGLELPPEADRPVLEVLQGGRHALVASPRLQASLELAAMFIPETGATSDHSATDGVIDFEATGPGTLRIAVSAKEHGVSVELLLHHADPRPLTPERLRSRVLEDWVAELERQPVSPRDSQPTLVLEEDWSVGGSSGSLHRTWRSPSDGLYLFLGVARAVEPISLGVQGPGRRHSRIATPRNAARRFQARVAWMSKDEAATIRIDAGPNVTGEIEVAFTVWVVVPRND